MDLEEGTSGLQQSTTKPRLKSLKPPLLPTHPPPSFVIETLNSPPHPQPSLLIETLNTPPPLSQATRRPEKPRKKGGKKVTAFLFSHMGLAAMVMSYSVMGGLLFQALEGSAELQVLNE